jgi:hypothetical protein
MFQIGFGFTLFVPEAYADFQGLSALSIGLALASLQSHLLDFSLLSYLMHRFCLSLNTTDRRPSCC